MWSWEQKSILIEVRNNLSFITSAKFIEVWHKEGYWDVTVYPQRTKQSQKWSRDACGVLCLSDHLEKKSSFQEERDARSANGFLKQAGLNSEYQFVWNILKVMAGYVSFIVNHIWVLFLFLLETSACSFFSSLPSLGCRKPPEPGSRGLSF